MPCGRCFADTYQESDDINRGIAFVRVTADGKVHVHHSGSEMGQGIDTRMAQVAACVVSSAHAVVVVALPGFRLQSTR
jgi:xanthine dehydrogenase molybdopterin-binding subunit B